MKIIRTITEEDFGRLPSPSNWSTYSVRPSARAVLMDGSSCIALMHVVSDNYYKLPGGGVDEGEDTETGLKRELLEEVGASEVEVISEIGQVDEYRDQLNRKSEHYGYIVRLIGPIVEPARTEEEIREGYETVWAKDIDEAIKLVSSGDPMEYGHDFEKLRELTFLEQVKSNKV